MGKKGVSVGDLVLYCLEKTVYSGEMMLDAIDELSYIRRGYGAFHIYPRKVTQPTLSQAIHRLRTKGFIRHKKDKDTGKIILSLTSKGRDYLMITKNEEEIEWDKRWRIVIFDIPEQKRIIRNVLRSRLKLWGFVQWQKSVWASKKPVTRQLRTLMKELEIEDWVLVLESDNVSFDKK